MIKSALLSALLVSAASAADYSLQQSTVQTSTGNLYWAQSRAALIPGSAPRVIITTQEIEKAGSHGYRNVYVTQTTDAAKTWSAPSEVVSLRRTRMPEGHDFVMGDICPQWHAQTGVVLATGKTFGFDGGVKENRGYERVSYATYSPENDVWSGLKLLALPEKDHEGLTILEPNAGCNQRYDLPNGQILLPIRYRRDPKTRVYTTFVARCSFDGQTLTYLEHGSELSFTGKRGLYEPSVTGYAGRFYLTMRADESAFVSVSDDGLHYTSPVEWRFDDGTVLGCYNAQQHWVTHSDALYLVYTRKGANNDHVFRHRAPLFIAQVDPVKLCVIRATEQILMPETGLDLAGGFGVLDFNANETWVVSTEMSFPEDRKAEPNRILLTKILWEKPNKLYK